MNVANVLLGLAGGLGLFVYGMKVCSESLQKIAAQRLKEIIKRLTRNRFLGLLVGIAITLGLQSSSATSALVVGFVSAGLMTMSQAFGVLLGSAIGASLTLQLIVFRVTGLALALLFIGASFYLFAKRLRYKLYGQTILGFGMIFYGMFVMSSSVAPLRDWPVVAATLVKLGHFPVLEFLVAVVGTVMFQSSPAFLALLITLAAHNLIGGTAIIPFVLGAHLGGTVTGVLSSLGTDSPDAKRSAYANFIFKLINGVVFLPFYKPLTTLILMSSSDLGRRIANAHTFFSLVMALLFLPLAPYLARLLARYIPDKPSLGFTNYLEDNFLNVPELAIDQAHRQILEMARIIREGMLGKMGPALMTNDETVADTIDKVELEVDALYKQISKYLTQLSGESLSDELMQKDIAILYAANDLEHIGDILMNMGQIIQKSKLQELCFSEEGLNEQIDLYRRVRHQFEAAMKAFETYDDQLARQVVKDHPLILRVEKEYRYNHFGRMQSGNAKTIATSAVHLDLIEAMLRIEGHALNIAYVTMGII